VPEQTDTDCTSRLLTVDRPPKPPLLCDNFSTATEGVPFPVFSYYFAVTYRLTSQLNGTFGADYLFCTLRTSRLTQTSTTCRVDPEQRPAVFRLLQPTPTFQSPDSLPLTTAPQHHRRTSAQLAGDRHSRRSLDTLSTVFHYLAPKVARQDTVAPSRSASIAAPSSVASVVRSRSTVYLNRSGLIRCCSPSRPHIQSPPSAAVTDARFNQHQSSRLRKFSPCLSSG